MNEFCGLLTISHKGELQSQKDFQQYHTEQQGIIYIFTFFSRKKTGRKNERYSQNWRRLSRQKLDLLSSGLMILRTSGDSEK